MRHSLDERITVTIPKGWGAAQTGAELARRGVVESALGFRLQAWRAPEGVIRAGEYHFEPGDGPREVLAKLHAGEVVQHAFGFPEGLTVGDVIQRMQQAGFDNIQSALDAPALRAIIQSPAEASGLAALEGWLYPDTYFYTSGTRTLSLFRRMANRMRHVLDSEWLTRPPTHPLTRYETLILASIIEKETGRAAERPLISGVFHNRLKRGMRLQSDPTVIYGIENFDGNITRKHLREATPYNTYVIPALPPTPIANPGRDAIHAALHPQETKAIFFVAKGNGYHAFSETLAQHNRNVRRYQLKKRKKSQ
ncbi:putative aminodeoxychorismate lyase [Magnetofaba australis IT-1]|uniref:Endolytic murein transglycosylase n=2 Tax=Magnetofaba TaxID=1472292 RepID=A0A1Y2K6S3_9PROT|nr:putative aminodeoxychorismate lyase [Magnetofaba australis IT-1]